MSHRSAAEGYRVLVCAPYARDAATLVGLLASHAYATKECDDLSIVAAAIDDAVGVVIVTEEALKSGMEGLGDVLAVQAPWSDVPFVMLAAAATGADPARAARRGRLLEITTSAVVLERPLGTTSILSATASAMRARQRQFEMRDRLAELDAQQARLSVLLDNLPVGVAFVDADESTWLANPAFRRFRPDGSIPPKDAKGAAEWQSYDEDGTCLVADPFAARRALDGERVIGAEYRFSPPTGDAIWTRVSAVPLKSSSGDIAGAITVIVDIDAQKRAQEQLAVAASRLEEQVHVRTAELEDALVRLKAESVERERAEASLRQSQKMEAVGQLTGGIAHDFNNMLTGIIGSLDLMRRRIATGRHDALERYLDTATASAGRAAALTHRLLAFSRRQSLDARPVEINALIGAMTDLIERAVDERVALDVVLAPDLPTALVDAHQLENAILNLAINARDAMPDGGTLTVATGTADTGHEESSAHPAMKPGRYVTVAVSDTGVGMSPELVAKVFDPFFTTKPLGQGTGLGLSMVYGFAEQSGGQVALKSEPGVGTTVTLHLPTTQAAPAVASEVAPAAAGDGERVLVVEDDPAVRMLVREVLEELRYDAVEFADPLAAVPFLTSDARIDLLISDVGLPGMNGRELAEMARTTRPDLPILFITGYAENAAIRAGFLHANMAMVTKPFSLEELAAKISQMIVPTGNASATAMPSA